MPRPLHHLPPPCWALGPGVSCLCAPLWGQVSPSNSPTWPPRCTPSLRGGEDRETQKMPGLGENASWLPLVGMGDSSGGNSLTLP